MLPVRVYFYCNQCNSSLTSEDYHVLVVLSLQCVSCLATVQSWVLWRKAILQIETAASSMSVDVWVVLICYSTQLRAPKKPNVLTENEQTSSQWNTFTVWQMAHLLTHFFSTDIFLFVVFHCREPQLLVLTRYLQVFHGAGVLTDRTVCTKCAL